MTSSRPSAAGQSDPCSCCILQDGSFATGDPQWFALTGLSPEDCAGSGWLAAIQADDRALLSELCRMAAEESIPGEGVFRLRCGGNYLRRQMSFTPMRGLTSSCLMRCEASHEMTTPELLPNVMSTGGNIMLVVGLDGRIRDASQAAVTAYGYTRDELTQLTIDQLRSEPTRNDIRRQMEIAHQGGILFETEHMRRDGSTFRVEIFSICATVEGEEVLTTIVRDVSHRKRISNELAMTRFTIDNAPASLWVEDDGRIVYANRNACELTGYSTEELLTMTVPQIDIEISAEDFPRHRALVRRNGGIRMESHHRRKDGSIFPVEVTVMPVEVDGHKLACSYFRSIEETRLLEEQVRQAQKMEAIGQLAGGIAHDFNNLLMVVLSHAELCLSHAEHDPYLEAKISAIRAAATRGATLTRQLLAFSRKQVLQPTVLDLNTVARRVVEMIRPLLGAEIDLTFLPTEQPAWVKVDAGQFEQVLLNLMLNARDAMPRGGSLSVSGAFVNVSEADNNTEVPVGDYVALSVQDNGCGMNEQTLHRIFEPFFSTKPKDKATGLGLSTAYGIIRQSGGYLSVISQPDCGSTFTIYLVPEKSRLGRDAQPKATPSAAEGSGEVVLLVEDEPELREVIEEYLKASGYRVLSAASHQQAVEIANASKKIDALLTDITLPGGHSGREVADTIQNLAPDLRTVFMSGYSFDELPGSRLREGQSFLQKPFTRNELLSHLRTLLAAAHHNRL